MLMQTRQVKYSKSQRLSFCVVLQLATRRSCSQMLFKIGAIKSFAKFIGKHLCQSLFFNKVSGLRPSRMDAMPNSFLSNYKTTILDIIFWNFTIFQYRSDSPQVKRNLTSSIANLVYVLPHELPNDLRLWVDTQSSRQSLFKNLDFASSN